MKITATRYHDFSYGHRVCGHESKCANLHGHNGRVVFHCEAEALDAVGRVIDFSVIKSTLCKWLEDEWDHKMLIYHADPWSAHLQSIDPTVVLTRFNPTAENMAEYLIRRVAPRLLPDNVTLTKVEFFETRKCGVTAEL
jgi:6-pyruvoyltetrahydropterin/6-carboxytetrahydropterin synthase